MAETIGSLVDKLSIIELKIVHMREQLSRREAAQSHKDECTGRLRILGIQRQDLCRELDELIGDIARGRREMKIYRQYKMYNDPKYKINS